MWGIMDDVLFSSIYAHRPHPSKSTNNVLKLSKKIRIEKVMTPPKLKGIKNSKKQTTKQYKTPSPSLKKFLEHCSVAITFKIHL
jgi:hypothetical protein